MLSRKNQIYYALPVGRPGLSIVVDLPDRAFIDRSAVKRAIDIFGASLGLLLLLPILVLTSLIIVLESPGAPLFLQRRGGQKGAGFTIYKFRTMRAPARGSRSSLPEHDGERVTRVGRFLRRTSIDELPQLLNVLKGDMSLVGPRPHALSHDEFYGQRIASYNDRFQIRPGLTGLAQTSGLCGPTPDVPAMAARIEKDLEYIRDWSLMLDFRIMLRTLLIVARRPVGH
jgi:putative colanic acid biosynthesis UDP-glucose lipid carrier transferase